MDAAQHLTDPFATPAGELLDARAAELLAEAAAATGLDLRLATPAGEALFGAAIPEDVLHHAGEVAARLERGGLWLRVQRLSSVVVAVGPYPRDARHERSAAFLVRLADDLLQAEAERRTVAAAHRLCMQDADQELQRQNSQLQAAVTRLQAADRVKASFVATMSHELRTPLTSVIGYSEMLLEGIAGPLQPQQQEYVAIVMEKGEQLLGIITGLLDLSRIEAGRLSLDRAPFDVCQVVAAAVSTVAPMARQKQLVVESELPEALPQVFGDREKVRQVVVNLLGNAVKFTPEGGHVRVCAEVAPLRRAGTLDASARGLRVAVSDSGIGIANDALPRIFDPFFQVDGTTTREYGGTGLGLAIVKSFVTAHGGTVWVESAPGRGSTFYVTLPIAE